MRNQQEEKVVISKYLLRTTERKLAKWIIATIDPVMLVIHLTIVYTLFLLADDFILALITHSFGTLINQSHFVSILLQGTKIFGALGTATGYVLHTTYSLYRQAKSMAKKIKQSEEASI